MRKYLLLLGLLIQVSALCQHRNDNWVFGDSAGINFTNPQNLITFKSGTKSRGTSATISDNLGNLLFYFSYDAKSIMGQGPPDFNGNVYDKNNLIMQNGDSIVCQVWYMEGIIIPDPSDSMKYFLFTIGTTGAFGLYYDVVDLNLNNGLGAVTQKNIQLLPDAANDGLTAVKHGNGRDWWLIHRRYGGGPNNLFYKYLITPSGISGPFTQNIGTITNTNTLIYTFNNEGNKIACVQWDGLCETFDFDRCTGMLSNHTFLHANAIPFAPKAEFFGLEFSLNGKYLYLSTAGCAHQTELIQIDLAKPNPFASADTISKFSIFNCGGGYLRRAPDNKIYWSRAWVDSIGSYNYPYPNTPDAFNIYNMNLSVINSPDSAGVKCDFTPYSFYLGGARTYWGLPNNPNYDMGPDTGSVCDSLGLFLTPALSKGEGVMQITYISAWEKLFVNASGLKGKNVTVSIYDGRGSLKFEVISLKSNAGYFTLDVDCSGWSDGLYVVQLQTDKERLSKKFVKE